MLRGVLAELLIMSKLKAALLGKYLRKILKFLIFL